MSVKGLFNDEIRDEVTSLSKMELGSEEYRATVNGVTQLSDRLIKMEEIELEQEKMAIEREKIDIEQEKVMVERKDKKVKNWLTALTAVIGAGITIWSIKGSYDFEGYSTHTSKAGNKSVDRGLNYFWNKK